MRGECALTAGVEFQVRKGLMDALRSKIVPCGNGELLHSLKSEWKITVLHVREITYSGDSMEHGWWGAESERLPSPGAEEAVPGWGGRLGSETAQESLVFCRSSAVCDQHSPVLLEALDSLCYHAHKPLLFLTAPSLLPFLYSSPVPFLDLYMLENLCAQSRGLSLLFFPHPPSLGPLIQFQNIKDYLYMSNSKNVFASPNFFPQLQSRVSKGIQTTSQT